MRARLLKPTDYEMMPWKNGEGMTTQVMVEPEDGSLENGFKWRLSMTEVKKDGPFSPFPHCQRTLLLLDGKGMELNFEQHGGKRLDHPFETVSFSGDWDTYSRLIEGPCRDFNVITAEGVHHRVSVLKPDPRAVVPSASTLLLFCAKGKATVSPTGATLNQEETLRLDDAGVLEVTAVVPDTVLLAVAIEKV